MRDLRVDLVASAPLKSNVITTPRKSLEVGVPKIRVMEKTENISIAKAAYDTVHKSEVGPKAVAAKMGLGHQILLNKVLPTNTTHHLHLTEAVKLMQVTGDYRIIEALADEFGGVYVKVGVASALAPNLVGDLANMSAEFGALMREIAADLEDGQITDNELARVEREAAELRTALAVLLADLRRVNQQGRKGALEA